MSEPIRVFISYASEDFSRVVPLYDRLLEYGVEPWMDKKNIFAGEKWESSIWRAVRRADFFLICLSNKAINKRGFLQREIREALTIWQEKLEDDIYLIPVRLEQCDVPQRLTDFHYVDLFNPDGFDQLAAALYEGTERIRRTKNQQSASGLSLKAETIIDVRREPPSTRSTLNIPKFTVQLPLIFKKQTQRLKLQYYKKFKNAGISSLKMTEMFLTRKSHQPANLMAVMMLNCSPISS